MRDRRPLMALLLTSLPNLTVLYAHVSRYDPFMGAVLERGVSCPNNGRPSAPSLRNLKELYLFPEVPVISEKDQKYDIWSFHIPPLRFDYLRPVFSLPNLRVLSLYDLNLEKADIELPRTNVSQIEDLYLICHYNALCTSSNIGPLVAQPKALKSFSFFIRDNSARIGENDPVISNSEVWDMLQPHEDSLRTIDFYREGLQTSVHRVNNGHFSLLRNFSNLLHLRVQVEVLLGGCCGSPRASFRLKDTLPSSLRSLTLYGEEGYLVHRDLGLQLGELFTSGDDFASLKEIVLVYRGIYSHRRRRRAVFGIPLVQPGL